MPGETSYQRIPFNTLFRKLINGNLLLKERLIISGEPFGPGIEIRPGELLSGVDFHKRQGLDLAVTSDAANIKILVGFYTDTE